MKNYRSPPIEFSIACELRACAGLNTSAKDMRVLADIGRAGGIRIIKATSGPRGYLAVGRLSKESVYRLMDYARIPVQEYEWREGRFCFVYDVVLMPKCSDVVEILREHLAGERLVIYRKRGSFSLWRSRGSGYKRIYKSINSAKKEG